MSINRYFISHEATRISDSKTPRWFEVKQSWRVRDKDHCIDGFGAKSVAHTSDEQIALRICDMLNGAGMNTNESNGYVTMPKEMYAAVVKERDDAEAQRDRGAATCTRVLRERDLAKAERDAFQQGMDRERSAHEDTKSMCEELRRRLRIYIGQGAAGGMDSLRQERDDLKRKYDEMVLTAARAQTELAMMNKGREPYSWKGIDMVGGYEDKTVIHGPVYDQIKRQILDEVHAIFTKFGFNSKNVT